MCPLKHFIFHPSALQILPWGRNMTCKKAWFIFFLVSHESIFVIFTFVAPAFCHIYTNIIYKEYFLKPQVSKQMCRHVTKILCKWMSKIKLPILSYSSSWRQYSFLSLHLIFLYIMQTQIRYGLIKSSFKYLNCY